MKTTPLPDQATLHQLLDYDPATGKLYWKPRDISEFPTERHGKTWNTRWAGKEALNTLRPVDGYKGGAVLGVNVLAHRVIFKMLHGTEPEQTDHDNRDRTDNRPGNLKDATAQSNSQNSKKYSSNTSGHTGVCWSPERQKWQAQIKVGHRTITLGRFTDINDAIAARKAAEEEHGFHPNHGV